MRWPFEFRLAYIFCPLFAQNNKCFVSSWLKRAHKKIELVRVVVIVCSAYSIWSCHKWSILRISTHSAVTWGTFSINLSQRTSKFEKKRSEKRAVDTLRLHNYRRLYYYGKTIKKVLNLKWAIDNKQHKGAFAPSCSHKIIEIAQVNVKASE